MGELIVALAVSAAVLAATPPGPSRLLVDPGSVDPYFQKGPYRAPAQRFRAGEWKAAAEGLAVALRARNAPKVETHRARFLLGLAQASLGNYTEAGATFERLWREEPLLRPYYAYQAAGCHLRRGDHERALVWAARVPPGSIPEAETALIRLEALSATGRWREVEREGKRYAEKFPNGPRGNEAAFSTAVAIEAQGRRVEAAELFRRIWADSRSDTWSQRALARLEKAGQAPVGKRAQEWLARGMVLFDRHQNEASEAAFAAALEDAEQRLDPAGECLARFHQAQSVWKQRNRTRAAPLFAAAEQACQRAGDMDTRARSLYQGGRCLAMTGNREAARAAFARVEADHPEHRLADDARLRAAESAWEAGDDATAAELARTLPQRYPDGDMVGEALWRLAYRSYRAEDFDQARHLLAENRRLVPRASIWYAEGRAEYWEGRILEKQKKPREAISWYQLAVRRYPLAVYALLAFGRLEQIAPDTSTSLRKELQPRSDGRRRTLRGTGLTGSAAAGLRRAVEFARMGLGSRSHRELARLYNDEQLAATSLLRDVTLTGALVLERAGLWNASHALVDDRLEQFRLFYPTEEAANPWVLAYPRAFRELVETHSRANNVSPELQLALMREESAFNPRAESTANCLGLTMLKPSTARGLLAKDVTREQLLDPVMNVAVGSRHLAALLKRFRSVVPVIAAYNAGEGPVARWLRERGHLPVDEFLEEIPYEETRGYTQRVLASFFAYSWLYGRKDRVPDVGLR